MKTDDFYYHSFILDEREVLLLKSCLEPNSDVIRCARVRCNDVDVITVL